MAYAPICRACKCETNSTQMSFLTTVVYCLILEDVDSEMDEEWGREAETCFVDYNGGFIFVGYLRSRDSSIFQRS